MTAKDFILLCCDEDQYFVINDREEGIPIDEFWLSDFKAHPGNHPITNEEMESYSLCFRNVEIFLA